MNATLRTIVDHETSTASGQRVPPDWFAGLDLSAATIDPGLGDGCYLKAPRPADDTVHRIRPRLELGARVRLGGTVLRVAMRRVERDERDGDWFWIHELRGPELVERLMALRLELVRVGLTNPDREVVGVGGDLYLYWFRKERYFFAVSDDGIVLSLAGRVREVARLRAAVKALATALAGDPKPAQVYP